LQQTKSAEEDVRGKGAATQTQEEVSETATDGIPPSISPNSIVFTKMESWALRIPKPHKQQRTTSNRLWRAPTTQKPV